jgi:putative aldouronate transport system permease protein
MMRKKTTHFTVKPFNVINIMFMLFFVFLTLYPFWNITALSFASYKEYVDNPLMFFPKFPDLSNYKYLVTDNSFLSAMGVTIFTTVVGTAYNMLLTTSMAYAMSKKTMPGYLFFWRYCVITMFISGGLVPYYILVARWLNLRGSLLAIILPFGLSVWYMIIIKNFFDSLPPSMEESAKIDGANDILILLRIIIPVSLPVMATFTLFFAVDRWNEWFNVMLFINKKTQYTLQYFLREMIVMSSPSMIQGGRKEGEQLFRFTMGIKMAAIVMATVPILCVYPFLQKYFIKGIMIGAVKG